MTKFCEGSFGATLQRRHPDFALSSRGLNGGGKEVEARWTNDRNVPCLARVHLSEKFSPSQEAWFREQLFVAVLKMVKQDDA